MFADSIDDLMRSYCLILVNYCPVPIPPEMSLPEWARWEQRLENRVICKTYFLEGAIEVSTVFIARKTYDSRQFETIVIDENSENSDEYRWTTYLEAWIAHLVIAMLTDLRVLKLKSMTLALPEMHKERVIITPLNA